MKWCWSRLPGGVVTWEAYELFKIGEHGKIASPKPLNAGAKTLLQIPALRLTHSTHSFLLVLVQEPDPKSSLTTLTFLRQLQHMAKSMVLVDVNYQDMLPGGLLNLQTAVMVSRVATRPGYKQQMRRATCSSPISGLCLQTRPKVRASLVFLEHCSIWSKTQSIHQ